MEKTNIKEAFGCDIGNGFGFVSFLEKAKQDPFPMIPPKYQLSMGMPTAAYITPPTGDPIVVFDKRKGSAEKMISKNPQYGIRAAKTRFHEEYLNIEGIENPVSIDQVYAAITRDLVSLANEQRKDMGMAPLYNLVLTYPAALEDNLTILNRMTDSVEKTTLDGHHLKVVGRLPEPAAVAIDYLYYMQNIAPAEIRLKEDQFTVLVYDLGHGTFDTALVTARSKGKPYEVLAKDGNPEVGGKDFDQLLIDEICQELKEKYDYVPRNPREREMIRSLAIETKHILSEEQDYYPNPQLPDSSYATEVSISRARFEELSQPLLFATLEMMQKMMEEANNKNIKIDAIVLSGGASRMPMVKNALESMVDKAIPIMLYRPSEAVSFGASRYALGCVEASDSNSTEKEEAGKEPKEKKKNHILKQFTEYKYGIFTESSKQLEGEIVFGLSPEKELPATSNVFELKSASSRIQIKIYRANEKKCTKDVASVKDCDSIRWFQFDVPQNKICKFEFTVEEDKNITVKCTLPDGNVIQKSTSDKLS